MPYNPLHLFAVPPNCIYLPSCCLQHFFLEITSSLFAFCHKECPNLLCYPPAINKNGRSETITKKRTPHHHGAFLKLHFFLNKTRSSPLSDHRTDKYSGLPSAACAVGAAGGRPSPVQRPRPGETLGGGRKEEEEGSWDLFTLGSGGGDLAANNIFFGKK